MYRPEDHLTGGAAERGETMLDAALAELLSGAGPPDMTGRILRAHAAVRVAAEAGAIPTALPIAPPIAAPPVVSPAPPVPWVSPSRRAQRQRASVFSQQWTGVAIAASVLVAGLGIGLAVLSSSGPWGDGDDMAQVASPPRVAMNDAPRLPRPTERPSETLAAPLENPFNHEPFGAEDFAAASAPGVPWQAPYAIEPQPTAKIVAFVDEQLTNNWRSAGLTPAPSIDDAAWAERVTQQLLGRAPTEVEVDAFAADRSPNRRAALVARLLHSDEHRAEFAQHWAKIWASELIPAAAPAAQREGLQQYLASALADEKPFSQITHELLTAAGGSDPRAADYNPATNFVLSGLGEQRAQVAATVGRVFLGHHGECAQCHDAVAGGELSQQQFWQIAAFFQQAHRERDASGGARLVDADFVGPTGDIDEAEILYDRPDRQRQIAYPVFIDGQAISPSGRVAEVNRRAELARLVVSSEAFSQAVVNRWWKELLGRGLASSHDDETNAELKRRLAEQFAAHGFDQKQLVAWIVLSEANARAAGDANVDLRHIAGAPLFDRYYGDDRPAAPYDTFAAALDAAQRGARPWRSDASEIFARVAPSRPSAKGDALVVARVAPARIYQRAASGSPLVSRLIASDMTYADKVQHLFLAAARRPPSAGEQQAARETLARYEGNVSGALEELWWAVEHSGDYRPLDE